LKGAPEIISRGFILPEELDSEMKAIEKKIRKTIKESNGNLENAVMQALKSYFYQETKRSPFIFVTISRS